MRGFGLLGAAMVFAIACGESTPPRPLESAHVRWTLSAASCGGGGPIVLLVDDQAVGTEPLIAGDTSTAYDVAPGAHLIAARTQTQPGRNWQPFAVTLKAGQAFTRVLECCSFCSIRADLSSPLGGSVIYSEDSPWPTIARFVLRPL